MSHSRQDPVRFPSSTAGRRARGALLATALVLLAATALADPAPEIDPGPKHRSRSAEVPEFVGPEFGPEPLGARHTVVVPAGPDLPRGGVYTDDGEIRPGGLTEAERQVFLAVYGPIDRVMRLLESVEEPGDVETPGPVLMEHTGLPGVLAFPPAAVSPDLPRVQEQGPPGLSPEEIEKRDRILARQAEVSR